MNRPTIPPLFEPDPGPPPPPPWLDLTAVPAFARPHVRRVCVCVCAQDRPRSALDQVGSGEREGGRPRMSVEEQLERMRRNQEASSLRERRREPLSRSASFNRDTPVPQVLRLWL